ncbi:zinc finger protein 180-like [Oreochromis aureus]|uniref:zinc finger protein 180-like n=1 Tax=Oreochromis aureus TaxID=47969 RepID=UPI0012BB9BFA|nr:zinc finger protein 180-like [Oreochromis aureus]
MPSVQHFRQFFNERLAAAAEEIFSAFEKTILEYEEEISRQRRLLDIAWKPAVKLPRIELPHQLACKEEEVLASDQQPIFQERNPRLDQEVKEELCTSQDREHLVLKQETDTCIVPLTYEKGDNTEDQTLRLNPSELVSATEKQSLVKISIKTSEEAELDTNHQLFSHSSYLSKSPDKEDEPEDCMSTGNAETKPQKISHKVNHIHNPAMLMNYCKAHASKKSFKCDTCGKTFPFNSKLIRHLRIHTGVRPYSCNICGKRFNQTSILKVHKRIHTGERPYSCNICGKRFNQTSILNVHKRTHTGEKPFSCNICGKRFNQKSILDAHVRIHTGEKPFSCKTCGKCLRSRSSLLVHMKKTHGRATVFLQVHV